MKQIRLSLALILTPLLCMAWNGVGHSTGGAITYYYLKSTSPATITKALNILKEHPWYNNPIWTDKLSGLTGEQREVALFMLASTFPDDARDSSYGKKPMTTWHYVDYPFVPAGETTTPPELPTVNAEVKITELLAKIGKEKPGPQKAIDLCWIFHLIEDVHQPLHASELYDKEHTRGDQGGNLTYFHTSKSNSGQKLHSYWDGLIKGDFSTAPDHAKALLKNPDYKATSLTELTAHTTVHSWIYDESYPLAKEKAYLKGKITGTKDAPSAAPDSYTAENSKIAERRIVLAGIRLGRELTNVLK